MLAYGAPANAQDDYLRMSESTAIECMYKFCRRVVGHFGNYYLRGPTEPETASIMAQIVARGFLETSIGCIGHGRTAYLLGKICTKGIMDIATWCLKLWQIMTYGFGILSLA
jgi:hypothetical protein